MQETEKKLCRLRGQLKDLPVSDANASLARKLIGEAILLIRNEPQLEHATRENLTRQLDYEISYYLIGHYMTASGYAAKTAAFNRVRENAVRWLTRAVDRLRNP